MSLLVIVVGAVESKSGDVSVGSARHDGSRVNSKRTFPCVRRCVRRKQTPESPTTVETIILKVKVTSFLLHETLQCKIVKIVFI